MSSKTEQHIENLLKQVEPGSTRHTILHSARQFKSSWAELGHLLAQVRNSLVYQEWGYADFAQYCAQEIRIRQQTADKLTHAYQYLKTHNPHALEDHFSPVPLPDYRSLNLLDQINNENLMEQNQLEDLRKQVFSGTLPHPKLARTFRDLKREHSAEQENQYTDLKNALSAAKRFQSSLENLPPDLKKQVELSAFIHILEQALNLMEPQAEP
ncbi:MAG: hypothetical protein RBR06_03665 [Desulfuromonadaceae bacterium]|nr:hypothetical protein [Desulfuromonadaceae bacterium]